MTQPSSPSSPHEIRLRTLLVGAWTSRAVTAGVELGVFDALAEGPKEAADLANALALASPASIDMLERLLLFLVDQDVLARDDEGFWLTDVSELLVDGVERTLAPVARLIGAPWHSAAWAALPRAIREGRSGYEAAHGRPLFEALADDDEAAVVFSRGVAPPESDNLALAAHLPLAPDAHIIDVGGGDGGFLASLLVAHPLRRGIVFDLHAAEGPATTTLEEHSLADRARFVAGSFFDGVPDDGGAYLLRWVLHNWSDDDAVKILSKIADAMPPDARLYVTELVLHEHGRSTTARLLDVDMMVLLRGRERSESEFRALFARAGLALVENIQTEIGFAILVAAKSDS